MFLELWCAHLFSKYRRARVAFPPAKWHGSTLQWRGPITVTRQFGRQDARDAHRPLVRGHEGEEKMIAGRERRSGRVALGVAIGMLAGLVLVPAALAAAPTYDLEGTWTSGPLSGGVR